MSQPVSHDAPKAYSYIRFSTPKQAEGDSLRRQTEKAARYALEHGLVLDTDLNLKDLGVSGYTGANAKTGALADFLRAVETGEVPKGSVLLVENMDRLTRADPHSAVHLFSGIIAADITIVSLTNEREWSKETLKASPFGMMEVMFDLIRGNQESVRKSQLVGAAKARLKERLLAGEALAKPYTRQTPAWIQWRKASATYELIPERALQIEDIFKRADGGQGIDMIAKDLNARGVDTWGGRGRKATYWHSSYIRKILTNAAVIGNFTPKTTTRSERGTRVDVADSRFIRLFPAAVPEELYWRIARRFATTAARGKNAGKAARSIVAGLAKCGACGASMVRTSKGGYAYLVCSRANAKAAGCKWLAVRYDLLEATIVNDIVGIVKAAPHGKSTAAIEHQIAVLEFACQQLGDEGSALARELAGGHSRTIRKRIDELDTELVAKQKVLRKMSAERETLTTASVRGRLKEVQQMLQRKPLNVVAANQALKGALRHITMNLEGGCLDLYWHHAEKPQELPFRTRHVAPVDWDAPPPGSNEDI